MTAMAKHGEWPKQIPTPTAACASGCQTSRSGKRKGELLLAGFARTFPKPTASMQTEADMEQARFAGNAGGNRPSYQEAKVTFGTPRVSDHKGSGPIGSDSHIRMLDKGYLCAQTATAESGGSLNPTWVCWLMGWPLGWTSLDPMPPECWQAWLDATPAAWWCCEPNAMDSDPHGAAFAGCVSRTSSGTPNRVNRLKCIGNGQVPAALVMAWDTMATA